MTFLSLAEKSGGILDTLGKPGVIVAVLLVLAVIVLIVKKLRGNAEGSDAEDTASGTIEATETLSAETVADPEETAKDDASAESETEIPHIPGYVVLDGVSEQDAAVVMAITSHQTGIDLARLDFKRIKRLNQNPELINIEEQDAAVVMAITSDKTGIPLENLIFNSIKLVED